jgi:hypothetical protein
MITRASRPQVAAAKQDLLDGLVAAEGGQLGQPWSVRLATPDEARGRRFATQRLRMIERNVTPPKLWNRTNQRIYT